MFIASYRIASNYSSSLIKLDQISLISECMSWIRTITSTVLLLQPCRYAYPRADCARDKSSKYRSRGASTALYIAHTILLALRSIFRLDHNLVRSCNTVPTVSQFSSLVCISKGVISSYTYFLRSIHISS